MTYPARSSPRGNRVGQRYLVAPRAASFRDKGTLDNRGYFKEGPEGSLYSAEESGAEENVQMPIHASGKWLVEINLEEPSPLFAPLLYFVSSSLRAAEDA